MKRYTALLTAFLYAGSSFLFAQVNRDSLRKNVNWPQYQHQISVGLNHVPSAFPFPEFYVDYGYQLAYKYKMAKLNLRAGLNANRRKWDRTNEAAWGTHEVFKEHIKINAGIEKQLGKKRYRFNYGGDLCIFRAKDEHVQITRYNRYPAHSVTKGIAIGPVIGFEYFLSHYFSFATEVNVDLEMNKISYDGRTPSIRFDVGTHRFGSFSINYSF